MPAPRMPRGLSPDAQKAWRTIVPALEEDGVLQDEDAISLELLAVAYSHAVQAQRIIDTEGLTSTGSQGQLREHPSLTTYRQSMVLVARFLDALGVGPVTRARLQIADHQRPEMHKALEARLGPAPRRMSVIAGVSPSSIIRSPQAVSA